MNIAILWQKGQNLLTEVTRSPDASLSGSSAPLAHLALYTSKLEIKKEDKLNNFTWEKHTHMSGITKVIFGINLSSGALTLTKKHQSLTM